MLKVCVKPENYQEVIEDAHISLGGIHEVEQRTLQRILLNGSSWPTVDADVAHFVAKCDMCSQETPVPYATLHTLMPTPNWASYMVDYFKHGNDIANMPKHRARLVQAEAS